MEELFSGSIGREVLDPSSQGGALNDLAKALVAGDDQTTSMTGGSALRVEDLERTLKIHTAQIKHARLWADISKSEAFSTVVQYTQQTDIGGAQSIGETGVPDEDDPTLARKYSTVKYIGSVGRVFMPLERTRTIENPWQVQTAARTIAIIRKVDEDLMYGDSAAIPTQFDGIWKQVQDAITGGTVNAENCIDFEQKRLQQEAAFSTGCRILVDNYANPENLRCYISPAAKETYEKELIKEKRLLLNMGANDVNIGINPHRFTTGSGDGNVLTDVFMKRRMIPTAATSTRAPNAPTVSWSANQASVGSKLAAGNYYYKVTAVNQYGESLPTTASSVQTISTTDKANILTAADNASTYPATAFRVYRMSTLDCYPTEYGYVWQFAAAASPWTDSNVYRAGCTHGILLDWDAEQVLRYRQLINFFALELARTDLSTRKFFLLAGVLLVYNPKRIVLLKNIGLTAWS
jgi:hypothetical protein